MMVELELVGLSEDGTRVLLADTDDHEFAVRLDNRLRAVIRGVRIRPGQLEIEMETALRPRDIQSRIRAGEAPEAVAQVAQVPVDRIMGYAVPVLAERQHIAERAQRSAVRRKNAEGPGRLLGDAVSERLRSRNVDPGASEWDAWRREDGRWTVSVRYLSGERERTGLFVFDALSRYNVAEDDDARWLVGEPTSKRGPQPREKGSGRRLTAVTSEDAVLSFDDEVSTADLTAVADALRSDDADDEPTADLGARPGDDDPDGVAVEQAEEAEHPEHAERAADDVAEETARPAEPRPHRRPRGRRGRASVPSWDEIMFGQPKE
ncbi:MAG: septation protein SepH [Nocardioidaceae bacterium]